LYGSCPSVIATCCCFSDLLALIRVFFWYDPIELEIIKGGPNSGRPRAANLDIEVCRQYLDRLLRQLTSFDAMDARTLVSHCSCCKDWRQVTSFLGLLIDFGSQANPSPMPDCMLFMLYFQFRPNCELRFVRTLEALYRFSGSRFSEHVHRILVRLNPLCFSVNLLDNCLELLSKCPAVYPLCCYIGMSLGSAEALRVARALSQLNIDIARAREIATDSSWALWPILMLPTLDKSYHIFVFGFFLRVIVADSDFTNVDVILSTFD
jgi:hypothetical protein